MNAATVRVLAAEGFEVFAPRSVRCRGALHLHSGAEPEALDLAKRMIATFEDCDYVAVTAAGCSSSMKDYGHLLSEDEEYGPSEPSSSPAEPRQLLKAIPDLEWSNRRSGRSAAARRGSTTSCNRRRRGSSADAGAEPCRTEADAIASGNPGCSLQINAYLRENGRPMSIHHPIELVDRSIRGVQAR